MPSTRSGAGPYALVLSGWRWPAWLGFLAAVILVASYLHLLSWTWLHTAIHRLGAQPLVQGAFDDPSGGRASAMFVVLASLLLTPPGIAAALFLLALTVAIGTDLLARLTRSIGVPEGWAHVIVIGGLAAVVYGERGSWVPELSWWLGLVARAYLVLVE